MSITFAVEQTAGDVLGFRVHHSRGGELDGAAVDAAVHGAYQDAVTALEAHNGACGDEMCRMYSGSIDPVLAFEAPEVNVSSMNARLLLDALGLGDEDMWEIPSLSTEDFRDRVIVAMSLSDADMGVPAYASTTGGGATWVDCGRRPGYLQDQLGRLLEVADAAAVRNRTVCIA